MAAAFIATWTGVGILVGAVLAACSGWLLISAPSGVSIARFVTPLLTGCAFATFAWRFGPQFDLLPYSILAALGVALTLIDFLEQRLPSKLVYPGIVVIGVLLGTSAILHSRGPDFLRALAGMATLAAFYLVLALASNGGLGAGDVKLGGLLGLAVGWLGWSPLIVATLAGWLAAALVWVLLRAARRTSRGSLLPMGPFLILGALLTISVMAA